MSFEQAIQLVPAFVLAFFRLAAMFLTAPLFGSARIPRRVKVLLALITAAALAPAAGAVQLPQSTWELAAGIAGEIVFGFAIGTAVGMVFVAVHWAGEIIGQQMGMNLGEVFDPQFGGGGSIVGELYFMLTLAIFLLIRGHHALLRGVQASFASLPLMSVGMDKGLLDLVTGTLMAATTLAIQLAAPMLVTMLVVDLLLGFLSKTVPQFNVMSAGLTLRSAVGMLVLIVGLVITSEVIRDAVVETIWQVSSVWRTTGG